MTLGHMSREGALPLPRGKEPIASLYTALKLPFSGIQRLHLHSDFAFSGSEADSFAPNLDHSPHEILCPELTDGKDLPLSMFPSEPGFQSGSASRGRPWGHQGTGKVCPSLIHPSRVCALLM